MNRILCVFPNWIGDSIFALPAVDALRVKFPDAVFDLAAKPAVADLHREGGRFRKVHVLPAGKAHVARFRDFWAMRREGYDLALVFPDSFSSAVAALLSGAKLRIGRAGEGRSPFLSPGLRLPKRTKNSHVVDEYLALAERLGAFAAQGERSPRLRAPDDRVEQNRRLFQSHGSDSRRVIGLCPTAAYGPAKQWPQEHWTGLALELGRLGFSVVLFCAPNERAGVLPLSRAAGGLPLFSPPAQELSAALKACTAVVANDSGSLHIAAAVGTPCLGLYGSTSPEWTRPRSDKAQVLTLNLPCSPCFSRECPLGHLDCLRKLKVQMVLESLLGMLPPSGEPVPGLRRPDTEKGLERETLAGL